MMWSTNALGGRWEDGWEEMPEPWKRTTPAAQLMRNGPFTTVEPRGYNPDVWQSLKQGHLPGNNPDETDSRGRFTTAACLAGWLADLEKDQQYGLLLDAVRETARSGLQGLSAVLKLIKEQHWSVDLNAYFVTSESLFSLPAFVTDGRLLAFDDEDHDENMQVLRLLVDAGVDLTLPAELKWWSREPVETLLHRAVRGPDQPDLLRFLISSGVGVDMRCSLSCTPLLQALTPRRLPHSHAPPAPSPSHPAASLTLTPRRLAPCLSHSHARRLPPSAGVSRWQAGAGKDAALGQR